MKKLFILVITVLMFCLAVPANAETAYLKDLLINGNAEDGMTGWTAPDGLWNADDEVEPKEGEYFFWPCNGGCEYSYMYQDVPLSGYKAGEWVILSIWLCNYDQAPNDQATVELSFLDAGGNVLAVHSREQRDPEWIQQNIFAKIPNGTVTGRVKLIATRFVGNDNDAYFDDVAFKVSDEEYSMVYITGDKEKAVAGDKVQLTATNGKSKNPLDFEWSTSYTSIATVDENGMVTFVGDGELTVYAKDKKTGVVGVYRFNSDIPNIVPPYTGASEWATNNLEQAETLGLIPDVLVGADMTEDITRAEFAAVSVKVYENLSGIKVLPSVVNPFKDTNDVEVLKAYNVGITSGTAVDAFSPKTLLNREQAAAMLTRVFKKVTMPGWTLNTNTNPEFALDYSGVKTFSDDASISDWAKESVYFMVKNSIISGMGNGIFAPKNITTEEQATGYANATREQALTIAVKMVQNLR